MAVSLLRTVILYIAIIVALRIMGKRQVGELEPSELVVTIMISEIAAMPMQDLGVPVLNGITSIFALLSFEVLISLISLKSTVFRNIITGKPSVLVTDGVIDQKELQKNRLSAEEFMEELRQANSVNLEQIKFAILETNGKLSIIKHSGYQQPQRSDLSLPEKSVSSGLPLVCDGTIMKANLRAVKKSKSWIADEMRKKSIRRIEDVFLMTSTEDESVFILRDNRLQ